MDEESTKAGCEISCYVAAQCQENLEFLCTKHDASTNVEREVSFVRSSMLVINEMLTLNDHDERIAPGKSRRRKHSPSFETTSHFFFFSSTVQITRV